MSNVQFSRRQMLQYMATLGVLSALPTSGAGADHHARSRRAVRFNSSSTAEEVTEGIDLSGMTIAITGANSGLGYETMRVLALRGAHVIGIARTQEKAEEACASVKGQTTPMFLDLADWESVVRCAEGIRAMNIPLDGLITNAGIMALPELELVNGVEAQFAVNHLGHFILINQLREPVLAAPQGRFTLLSSRAHRRADKGIEFDNLDGSKHYDPWRRLRRLETRQRIVRAGTGRADLPHRRHRQQRTPRHHPDQPGQEPARLAALGRQILRLDVPEDHSRGRRHHLLCGHQSGAGRCARLLLCRLQCR